MSVCVFLPIDLTNTLKFFNNKGKGDRTRDQKIIIHIPSHFKNAHICAHTRECLQNFITLYTFITIHVFGLHTC